MTTSEMFGRTDELRALTDSIDGAAKQGGALLMLGEPGIGKSTLIQAASRYAEVAGLQVLSSTGVEAEAQLPFAGLHQLLRPVLPVAVDLPAVQERALMSAFGVVDAAPPEPFMIALAALSLLADASARRTVLVAIDDAQWLDRPTQEALAFVARRVGNDPIMFLATVRTGHRSPLLEAGLPELVIGALDDAASRSILERNATGLRAPAQERIFEEARGNPLALVELPVAWRAAGESQGELVQSFLPLTRRLERAFSARIGDLPALTRDALLIAAVDPIDELPEVLAAATILAGRRVGVEVLDGASAAGLLRFDELRVHFRHPLVRSGVLQSETIARRHGAHAALAAVLGHEPYRRAWHRAQSIVGPDDDAADELEASHLVPLRRGSVTSAIWALERAAQLSTDSATRGRRLLLAAQHAFELGRADLVDRLLEAADRTTLSDLALAQMEWLREIFNDGVPGDAVRVLDLCDLALRSIAAGDRDLALNLLFAAALRCWLADTGPAARARVAEVIRQVPGDTTDPRFVAALAVAEPVSEAATVVGRLSTVVVEKVANADDLRLFGMAAHAVGEPVYCIDLLDRAETKLREQGRLGLLSQVLTVQILSRIELGDWDRAAAVAEEGRRLAQETRQPMWDTGTQLLGAMVAGLRGDNDTAQAMASEAEHAASGGRSTLLLACAQLARGYGWIGVGDHSQAYAALRQLFEPSERCFHQAERFHGVMFLAEAAVHVGRVDEARAVVEALEAVARVTPSSNLRVHLAYARAVLAEDEAAEALYLAGLKNDLVRWPWMQGRLQLAYGSWLRRQRRVAESRPPLRAAQATFDLIGAPIWAAQARTELRAAGERVAADGGGNAAQEMLSAQELQIARLAGEGLSNREIGERLFLSPRTVGSHLYRIFPKLNITSRSQLAARLGTQPGSDR
jgi:DNA-binding CsgD family transcriptional regulator